MDNFQQGAYPHGQNPNAPPPPPAVPPPVVHTAVWDHSHSRAFNVTDHPSLVTAPTPRAVTGAHGLTAASPALVGVYPAASSTPYPMAYVPAAASKPGLPEGFYVACVPGEEFVVRVGGRGGMDAVCNFAGCSDVLVNVTVGGREVGDSSVFQAALGDVNDDCFFGFKDSEDVSTGEARYSKFCFEKAEILSEEEAKESVEKTEDAGEDKKLADVGLLEVRFATAVRIPAEPGAAQYGAGGGSGGAGGNSVRTGKGAGEVGGVSERLASKHGVSVGVAGSSSKQVSRRNYMTDAVCFGEDVKEMAVKVRMRELWWLRAKGVMPSEDGTFVKHEASNGIFLAPDENAGKFIGSEIAPPSKKAKLEAAVDLVDGDDDDDDDDDDDVDSKGIDCKSREDHGVEKEERKDGSATAKNDDR